MFVVMNEILYLIIEQRIVSSDIILHKSDIKLENIITFQFDV